MADEWAQGEYLPENKGKYVFANGKNPYYRSSWERRVFVWADNNSSVVKWSSEPFAIEYQDLSDKDRIVRRYFPDVLAVVKGTDGKVVKYLIEIKPKNQCPQYAPDGKLMLPPQPKKKSGKAMSNWHGKVKTIVQNHCKWMAARNWCRKNGYVFKVITEDNVF